MATKLKYLSELQATQQQHLLEILNNQKLTDVTFIVGTDKKQFRVNRIFLQVISSVFEQMLCGDEKEVVIDDIDVDGFECILKFAYFNDPGLNAKNIASVKYICDKYQIETLLKHIPDTLKAIINENNFLTSLENAVKYKYDKLITICTQHIKSIQAQIYHPSSSNSWNRRAAYSTYPRKDFCKKIIATQEFLELTQNSMNVLISLDQFAVKEDIIWKHLIKWADYQSKKQDDNNNQTDDQILKNKLKLLKSVKKSVRFGLMENTFFATQVTTQNILEPQEMLSIFMYLGGNTGNGCGGFNVKTREGA